MERLIMQSPESLPVPSTYRPEFAEEARKLALAQTSDEALARYFEIPLATLHEWLEAVPEFARAVHSGRKLGDVDVVERFRQSAMGVVPNKTARAFWLANRLPGEWRAKIEIEAEPSHEYARHIPRPELERLAAIGRDDGTRAGQRR
jgi:hypothetical protein